MPRQLSPARLHAPVPVPQSYPRRAHDSHRDAHPYPHPHPHCSAAARVVVRAGGGGGRYRPEGKHDVWAVLKGVMKGRSARVCAVGGGEGAQESLKMKSTHEMAARAQSRSGPFAGPTSRLTYAEVVLNGH